MSGLAPPPPRPACLARARPAWPLPSPPPPFPTPAPARQVEPDESVFYDELNLYGQRLQECSTPPQARDGLKAEDGTERALAAPTTVHVRKLFLFQQLFANNYFHFLAESATLLMRLLHAPPHAPAHAVLADPEVHVFASILQPFGRQLLAALGLADRLLPYDPCSVYRARSLYLAVGGGAGQSMPTAADAGELRRLLLRPSPPLAASGGGQAKAKARAYILLLDRSDAKPRLLEDGRTVGIPRHLLNFEQVRDVVSRALVPTGVALQPLRTASLSLAEQARQVSGAVGLIGVHGAGLTNALFLPPDSGVLEVVPARHRIPNAINLDDAPDELDLSSTCGFTMFWCVPAVAATLPTTYVPRWNWEWRDGPPSSPPLPPSATFR